MAIAASDARAIHLFIVAPAFIAFYDHALTLDREVTLIWKCNFDPRAVLYLVTRYFGELLLLIVTVYGVAAKIWLSEAPVWNQVPQGIALTTVVIAGCRMVLNLRQVFHKRDLFEDDLPSSAPLHFISPFPNAETADF
ncbi:hypothetical protein SERLA73DRAFT_70880 [Serpula lacrymans var. lacrymans S7.3]|uniref:DUF6533 domain-containing protein n=2 Tax=Serpula lacrymans var. lacrymans TaxID=341189 RepID=F8PNI6_SERL3|nr:uncharacterized protein SERLADRAFT_435130 [Serpula lacrymans var. lacrymans S7.9]EGO01713.1 hypothetical protein SERLA73DRAFT_70880 [Serpula lacrymans var. lacrymans S7.3]EGO27356.1 hypothetical protein SERLADRAFT_435130 [Serpula lacrymans var. lacrymans S7.9]